jgi:membrane fusion protein
VAQQGGVVEEVLIREGTAVLAHQRLFALADPRARATSEGLGSSIDVQLQERRRALAVQRKHAGQALQSEQASLEHRRTGLERELAQLDAEVEMLARRVSLSRQGAQRWLRLEGGGFISAAAADREREAAFEIESRFEAARRTRLALERELAAVHHDAQTARSRGSAQLATIDAQAAVLEQEQVERDVQHRMAVLAPLGGTVAAVLVEPGQPVAAGTPLVTILPAGAALEAHLFAPSRSIGFLRVGQEVLLRYHAYPHQKFGSQRGWVTAIARSPLAPSELGFVPPDGTREPLYRIKARVDSQSILAYGREEPLQAGMQLEADIQLDRRRLIEWVFEPLLSLAGRT